MHKVVIPIILVILMIATITTIINIINTAKKEKRISAFALSKTELANNSFMDILNEKFWNTIHKFSNIFEQIEIIRILSNKYEKYILVKEENYKSAIDYITVKIFSILVSVILALISVFVESIEFNVFIALIFVTIGYFLPEFIWKLSYLKKCNQISHRLYESIIIIDDSLKNTTIYNSIDKVTKELDGAIQDEYERIKIDLSYNLTLYQAFKRFYERTQIPEIKNIYHLLIMDGSEEETFHEARIHLSYLNKLNNIKTTSKLTLELIGAMLISIPIILTILIAIIRPENINPLFQSPNGILLFFGILLLYSLLIYIIRKIVEVVK